MNPEMQVNLIDDHKQLPMINVSDLESTDDLRKNSKLYGK